MPPIPLFPERASSVAGQVDNLFFFVIAVSVVFSMLIASLLIGFFVRYRRRHPGEIGASVHGSIALEVTWTMIPLVISLFAFGWGAKVFFTLSRPPLGAAEYYVVAKQWMWKFQHPQGRREINELHVPVGLPVKLIMTSEDVIHSFFVPAFRVKTDVLPGRYTTAWFTATRPGRYHLFCAEYCGAAHARMGGWVTVMEPRGYENWLAGDAPGGVRVGTGEEIFNRHACNTCHRPDTAVRGPSLVGLFGKPVKLADGKTVVADETYIRESILSPTARMVAGYEPLMPTFRGQLSEEELIELVKYVKSLGKEGTP